MHKRAELCKQYRNSISLLQDNRHDDNHFRNVLLTLKTCLVKKVESSKYFQKESKNRYKINTIKKPIMRSIFEVKQITFLKVALGGS